MILPQSYVPLFPTKLAHIAAVPLKSEQLELDSIHPLPFVTHPNLYEAHAESVVILIGAFEQLFSPHGEISNLQYDLND